MLEKLICALVSHVAPAALRDVLKLERCSSRVGSCFALALLPCDLRGILGSRARASRARREADAASALGQLLPLGQGVCN